ncbi:MAG: NAD-dependent epimerase/dehydratase family protein [Euryarchaeota archaeon]|nr:NAD-dependent epimerase/dehydratase family protein [Euryarchaeota archaeon]
MKCLVTGGAGFIGSHLVDRLLDKGNQVRVFDNLSSGRMEFLGAAQKKKGFEFVEADLLDLEKVVAAMKGVDMVFHIAANPDIRYGTTQTDVDLKQGTIATYNVLEAMRRCGVKKIAFSSSSTVYGEATKIPVPEDYGPVMPISLYGASKLAAEGLITAYSSTFDIQAWIFRFANIIGSRGTHGVIVDFINKLEKSPRELEILGDGTQSKSYLLVEECVDGIMHAIGRSNEKVNIFNLGCEDWVTVARIAEIVVGELGLKEVSFNYTGGKRGWRGDVPKIMLAPAKLGKLGWKAKHGSDEAVVLAARAVIREMK